MGFGIIIGILTYLLPAVVLFFAVRLVVQGYLKNEERKRASAKSAGLEQTLLPLKLQAMERLILLLERMSPIQAVNRAMQPGMSGTELQMALLRMIREEYEHNTAQQLYISQTCWALIKSAKEEALRMVNLAASRCGDQAKAGDLAGELVMLWSGLSSDPIQAAIDQLKKEL